MKTAKELASSTLDSAEGHKRRAQALRRLATGVQAEVRQGEATGLSDSESSILLKAADVLADLAARFEQAKAIAQVRSDSRAAAEVQVRLAMKANFNLLVSLRDQVALVASISEHMLKGNFIRNAKDLNFAVKEALDSLAYSLSQKAVGGSPSAVVDDAWQRFVLRKGELTDKYDPLITMLTSIDPR